MNLSTVQIMWTLTRALASCLNGSSSCSQVSSQLSLIGLGIEKIMTHFSVTDGKNIAGDHDYPRIEFKNEPQAENVLKRFGYFD